MVLAEDLINSRKIQDEKTNDYPAPLKSFVLESTDEDEIEQVIISLKTNCSVGWDGISNALLKQNRKELIAPLTHIGSKCLELGIFPKDLKLSQAIPIHKGGDKDQVHNYRPIAILPALSKILEKIINLRLVSYLESNKILSQQQFGFRCGKSTDDAVNELVEHISLNLDKGNKCVTIYLDLAKAFDSISVPLLIKKLEKIGITGKPLDLFIDYLTDREQAVRIGSHISATVPITYGVPQGSILGPTLFKTS